MILFNRIRTKRIDVQLRELQLGEAIAICRMPGARYELTASALLRCVADQAKASGPGYVTDPRLWTMEERAYLIANYLAVVAEDGPDFAIGENRLSHYISFTDDFKAPEVDLGEFDGRKIVMRPLLGIHGEDLEVACTGRGDWVIGAMACQIFTAGEPEVDWLAMTDVARMTWVRDRMALIRQMPESQVEDLLLRFMNGQRELYHFFIPCFDSDGLAWECREGGGAGNQPARFRALSCIGSTAQSLSR
jgi:hypothetical protein